MKTIKLFILIACLSAISSCKKFLEIPPPKTQLEKSNIFEDDNTATSAMVGIYSNMMTIEQSLSGSLTIDCGLYADELLNLDPGNQFINSNLTADNSEVNNVWVQLYNYIYSANAVIEGVTASSKISASVKSQLLGEAKFVRALGYFYLVNLWGDVPLVTTTDYLTNSKLPRASQTQVFAQIIADLKDAQDKLGTDYSFSNGEKVRPNKYAAAALLARVYLYTGDDQDAVDRSAFVINSSAYSLTAPGDVFLKNSNEAIWQLLPVDQTYDTFEGNSFIPPDDVSAPSYFLTNTLMAAFEPGDLREQNWVGKSTAAGQDYFYPFKYKQPTGGNNTEYYMVFRLAELYLVRAEALAHQNQPAEAVADINIIRQRAGLAALSTNLSADQVLQAVAQERRVEFFAEWGHRWFDLKRTQQASAVLSTLKPSSWKNTAILWPIPVVQINANNALKQNPGY